jgi:hypothetical protein
MVSHNLKYVLFLLLIFCSYNGYTQQVYSEVDLSKNSVYIGEPVEVRVSVFTSTWFTKGVDPGNVKVDGAFTIYFRGVSTSKQVKGKTHAGVQMIFNVFPYEQDDIVFPSLEITVETPPEGGYKGVRKTIKTREKPIQVKPVPKSYGKADWLVSTDVVVAENWIGNRKNVKVGEVLERRITRTAAGTVSGLIPALSWDTLAHVSAYPARSSADDMKTKTAISAKRTDGIKYLFEKEGEVTLPKIEIQWWNPVRERLYKRTIREIKINVQPNPNLGMLESVRDSLATLNSAGSDTSVDQKNFWQRLTKTQISMLIVLMVLLIYLIYKFDTIVQGVKGIWEFYRKKREAYRRSEKYYFRQFILKAKSDDRKETLKAAYQWIDRLKLKEPTLKYFAGNFGNDALLDDIDRLETQTINSSNKVSVNIADWKLARQEYMKTSDSVDTGAKTMWINP